MRAAESLATTLLQSRQWLEDVKEWIGLSSSEMFRESEDSLDRKKRQSCCTNRLNSMWTSLFKNKRHTHKTTYAEASFKYFSSLGNFSSSGCFSSIC